MGPAVVFCTQVILVGSVENYRGVIATNLMKRHLPAGMTSLDTMIITTTLNAMPGAKRTMIPLADRLAGHQDRLPLVTCRIRGRQESTLESGTKVGSHPTGITVTERTSEEDAQATLEFTGPPRIDGINHDLL